MLRQAQQNGKSSTISSSLRSSCPELRRREPRRRLPKSFQQPASVAAASVLHKHGRIDRSVGRSAHKERFESLSEVYAPGHAAIFRGRARKRTRHPGTSQESLLEAQVLRLVG